MYDDYEPVPVLACPACAAPLSGWQGKAGPCRLLAWRQGSTAPVDQHVDPTFRLSEIGHFRLPEQIEMCALCLCGKLVDAVGDARGGTWSRTMVITAPTRFRQGASGRWSCPCCDCTTLEIEPPGTFQICPVCRWEDVGTSFLGDANRLPLHEARRSYFETGASDPDVRHRARAPLPEERA